MVKIYYSASTAGFYQDDFHTPEQIPSDAVEITDAYRTELLNGQSQGKLIVADANGYPVLQDPPGPTQEQINAQILAEVQNRLDTFARTRNYDGILSLATYATSTTPKFAAEGQYGVEARDNTWAAMYQIEQEVLAGTRPAPQSYADIEADLPALNWPA